LNKFRYASDICLGTTLLWFLWRYLGDTIPVWGIVSFIVVTDPSIEKAQPNFLSRVTNTLLGCIAGIIIVLVFGSADWMLPIALTITALACTLLIEGQSNWKLATATAALVLTSAIASHSSLIPQSKWHSEEQVRSLSEAVRPSLFPGSLSASGQ
jgi:uncharacterized membrane protein YgaE (UPF0421/DUF939 family)